MTHKEMMLALLDGQTIHRNNPNHASELKLIDGQIRDLINHCADGLPPNPAVWVIKANTININGIEVSEPIRVAPEKGTIYHMPHVIGGDTISRYWTGCTDDYNNLHRGIIHLTKDAASTHTTALLSFTKL